MNRLARLGLRIAQSVLVRADEIILKEGGHAADVVVHPAATHQWDNPASTGGRQISMGWGMTFVRDDPDTARDSVTRAVAHFRATL